MVMPSAWQASTIASTARVAAGSSAEVGSSRNSTSGASAQARAMARRCCSPPDSVPRGAAGEGGEPEALQRFRRRGSGARARGAPATASAWTTLASARAAQQHRPLEHHGVPAARVPRRAEPGDRARRRPDQPVAEPERQALSGAVRAEDHRPAALADLEGKILDDRLAAERQRHGIETEREGGVGRVHRAHAPARSANRPAA